MHKPRGSVDAALASASVARDETGNPLPRRADPPEQEAFALWLRSGRRDLRKRARASLVVWPLRCRPPAADRWR